MTRSRNGTGTITQRADGRWMGQIRIAGKRHTVYGKTRAEAAQKLTSLQREALIHGGLPEKVSLFSLIDQWLAVAADSVKPWTLRDYRRYSEVIKAHFGDIQLQKLTPPAIQLFYSKLKAHPRKAYHIHQVLHRLLAVAVQWGYLTHNPADRVVKPVYRKSEHTYWTVEQVRQFLDSTRKSEWWPLWVVALETGCRIGELIALKWSDVNWEEGTIQVRRSLGWIDKQWVETTPKTQSGYRTVFLGPLGLEALRRQWELQEAWKAETGPFWYSEDRIFTNRSGGPLRDTTATHALWKACDRVGLPRQSMHRLRHLHGSLAIHAGVPIALVSKHLGHANVSITTSIYSHALGEGAQVREGISRALLG